MGLTRGLLKSQDSLLPPQWEIAEREQENSRQRSPSFYKLISLVSYITFVIHYWEWLNPGHTQGEQNSAPSLGDSYLEFLLESWGIVKNRKAWPQSMWYQRVGHDLELNTEKPKAPHSSTLAWKIPWTEEPGRLQSMVLLRVRLNWATSLSLFTFMHWRRKWQPTPVFLPGESQGRGSLVGYRLIGSHRVGHDWSDLT